MSARATCSIHPGIYIDQHPCYRCPQPEEAPVTPLTTVTESIEADSATVTVDGTPVADITAAIEKAARDTWKQDTLSDAVFPPVTKKDIPMVKLAFAGSVEMSVGRFLELLDGDLEVGAIVECAVTGHFTKLGTGWKKRSVGSGDGKMVWWEQEGQPGIAVDEVGGLHITGETWSDADA